MLTMEIDGITTPDKRLDELEIKAAYQERTIADLNALAFEQAKRLDRVETALKHVMERLRESGDPGERMDVQERPPHY